MTAAWGVKIVAKWSDRIVATEFVRACTGRGFSIGTGSGVDLAAETGESADAWRLIDVVGGAIVLRFTERMKPELFRRGDPLRLTHATSEGNGVFRLELAEGDLARLRVGSLSFEISTAAAVATEKEPLRSRFNPTLLAMMLLGLGAAVVLGNVGIVPRVDPSSTNGLSAEDREVIRRVLFAPAGWAFGRISPSPSCRFGIPVSEPEKRLFAGAKLDANNFLFSQDEETPEPVSVPPPVTDDDSDSPFPHFYGHPEVLLDDRRISPAAAVDDPGLSLAIGNALAGFRECYAERTRTVPQLCAQMTVSFAISEEGVPFAEKLHRHTKSDPELERCVLKQVHETDFPGHAKGNLAVALPLSFVLVQR